MHCITDAGSSTHTSRLNGTRESRLPSAYPQLTFMLHFFTSSQFPSTCNFATGIKVPVHPLYSLWECNGEVLLHTGPFNWPPNTHPKKDTQHKIGWCRHTLRHRHNNVSQSTYVQEFAYSEPNRLHKTQRHKSQLNPLSPNLIALPICFVTLFYHLAFLSPSIAMLHSFPGPLEDHSPPHESSLSFFCPRMRFLLDTGDNRRDHMRSHALIAPHDRPDDVTPVASITLMCPLHHTACTNGSTAALLCSTLQHACDRPPSRTGGHSRSPVPWITGFALLLVTPSMTGQMLHVSLLSIVAINRQHNESFTTLKTRCT